MSTEISSSNNRKEYMKEYMRNRYSADLEKARGYKNSLRYKSKLNISEDDFNKYGCYLADVIKLKKLISKIPLNLKTSFLFTFPV